MVAFDNIAFDAAAYDAGTDGRFGISLPPIFMPRPKLSTGLAWLSFPRYFGLREAVGGLVGTMQADTFYHGDRIESTNIAGGGIGWGWNTQLENISNRFSMLWYGQVDTFDTASPLICIRADTGWKAINFNRNWTTSQLQCSTRGVSNGAEANSNSSAIATGERMKLYAVTYVEGNFTFYVDGELLNSSLQTHYDIDWKDKLGVAVMGRRPDDIDGGLDGSYVMAAIYSRALTQGELRAIALNPATVLEPTPAPIGYQPVVIAPPVASFAVSPESGNAPLLVQFTDTSTGTIDSRYWDFTNDGLTDASIANPQHTYTVAGNYTVRLRVANGGGYSEVTRTIAVTTAGSGTPAPGSVYSVEMDFGRDGTFAHAQAAISGVVQRAQWSMGMGDALQEFASPSRLSLTITNDDGAWNLDNGSATYNGLIVPGVLVRVRATFDGTTYTLWTGKVTQIVVTPGEFANENGAVKTVTISAEDPMAALLDAEYTPTLLLDSRTDEGIQALFDAGVFAYPYDKSYFLLDVSRLDEADLWDASGMIDLEEGYTTLPWIGDNLDKGRGVSAQTYLREIVASEAGGRFFWSGRTAKFTFHNRYHDEAVTPLATMGGDYVTGAYAEYGKHLANYITVQYEPRAIGAAGTTLWELESAFTLRPGQERVLTARFRDPDNKEAKVSALLSRAIYLSDLQANILEQSSGRKSDPPPPLGANVTAQISATFEAFASSAKITVRNPLGVSVSIQSLSIKGTPLTAFGRDEITVTDADSIEAYDRREMLITLRAVDDPEFAEGLATLHLHRRKSPVIQWATATIKAGWRMTDAYHTFVQEQAIRRTVGDRIRIQETWGGHDAEYIIVGEQHSIDNATSIHQTTWTLKAAQLETWFTLDVSNLDSNDVIVL